MQCNYDDADDGDGVDVNDDDDGRGGDGDDGCASGLILPMKMIVSFSFHHLARTCISSEKEDIAKQKNL